jgi:hypothetical protein
MGTPSPSHGGLDASQIRRARAPRMQGCDGMVAATTTWIPVAAGRTCGGGGPGLQGRRWLRVSWTAGSRTRCLARERHGRLEAAMARSGWMTCHGRRRRELPVIETAWAQSRSRWPWSSASWVHCAWSRTYALCVSSSRDTHAAPCL